MTENSTLQFYRRSFLVAVYRESMKFWSMKHACEQGFALITVLWALILLSLIAAALSFETRFETRTASNMAENAAARAAADAGIQRAILDLETNAETLRTDGSTYIWQFGNCRVRISIQDETGKVNLNQAPELLLAALFMSVGLSSGKAQSLADAVADYRDEDGLRRPRGAEYAEYRAAALAWGPKNAPFQAVEELKQVFGMTDKLYQLVAPRLTIYSIGAGINPSLAGNKLTAILRDAGFKYFVGSQGVGAYSIRSESKDPNSEIFVRQAIIQVLSDRNHTWILSWIQGDK